MNVIAKAWKALLAGVIAALSAAVAVLVEGAPTALQYVIIALAFFVAVGGVYEVTNKESK